MAMDGGGTRTYWRGLRAIVPSGKDEMAGHPGALGGSRYQQLPHKKTKDSFRKGKVKLHKMIKAAQPFMAGSVAGPKASTQMKKVKSGFATPKIHKASQVKPITGSVNLMKTAQESILNGFGEELHKEAAVVRQLKTLGGHLKSLITGKSGATKVLQKGGPAATGTTDIARSEAAKRFGKSVGKAVKRRPGTAAAVAGGTGYLAGRSMS